jgi:hypothetical protein
MLSAGELAEILKGLPEDAAVEVLVRTEGGVTVDLADAEAAGASGPDPLGHSAVVIHVTVQLSDW